MSEMKLKVSEKGGVSLYGLGRFPVTLYAEQWQKLLGEVENIKKFLEDNKTLLKTKNDAKDRVARLPPGNLMGWPMRHRGPALANVYASTYQRALEADKYKLGW